MLDADWLSEHANYGVITGCVYIPKSIECAFNINLVHEIVLTSVKCYNYGISRDYIIAAKLIKRWIFHLHLMTLNR